MSYERDNLVYVCHACNEYKGEFWGDAEDTRLLLPLNDLKLHIQQNSDGMLEGISPAGQRYIAKIQLNRLPLVLHRKKEIREEKSISRYEAVNGRLDQIMTRIERIEEHTRRS